MPTLNSSAFRVVRPVLAGVLCALLLVACGKDGKPSASHGGSQVVARVNGDEISVLQVTDALSRLPAQQQQAAGSSPELRRKVLDGLVDQQIAVQQAVEHKLDRSPEVLTAIEAARRQILARAYLNQEASGTAKPTEEEARKYYAEHPELFASRKLYRLQEVIIPGAGTIPADKLAEYENARSIEQVIESLKAQNIKYTTSRADRAAEQIPLGLIKQIEQLKDGQMLTLKGAQAVSILQLVASRAAPVSEAEALPRIQQFLVNQRTTASVEADLKALRGKAKLEYLGEFANAGVASAAAGAAAGLQPTAATPPAAPGTAATPPAAPGTAAMAPAAPAAAVAPAAVPATGMNQTNLDKGVSGLR